MPFASWTWPQVTFFLGAALIAAVFLLVTHFLRVLETRSGKVFEERISKLEGQVRALGVVATAPNTRKAAY